MPTLKNIILDSVENNFSNNSDTEKSLLYCLSMKKIFSLPYYKDRYYTSSISYLDDNIYGIHVNGCNDVGPSSFSRTIFSNHRNEYDNEYYASDSQHYLFDDKVIERLEKFSDITKNNKNLDSYISSIMNQQEKDSEFLPTVHSYSFIFNNFNDIFINEDFKRILKAHGNNDSIDSNLCKTVVYLSFFGNKDKTEIEIKERWENNFDKRNESLNNSLNLYKPIENFYILYEEKINKIIQDVYEKKPFLFEDLNKQKIELYYIELKGIEEYSYNNFELENINNFAFEKSILEKNNIKIAPIHFNNLEIITNEKKEEYQYKKMQNDSANDFFINFNNDLTDSIPSKFFGLDYLNRDSFRSASNSVSYIIAKNEEETVGFISIYSIAQNNKSIMKSIGSICVKENFRGNGLAYKLYDSIANILEEQGNILTNSMYSSQGKLKLPRLKQRISENHPELVMINAASDRIERSEIETRKYELINSFNNDFVSRAEALEKRFPEDFCDKKEDVKKIYKESIKYLNDNYMNFEKYSMQLYDFSQKQTNNMSDIITGKTLENSNKKNKKNKI